MGRVVSLEHFLPPELLPSGFSYPVGYRRLVEQHPQFMEGLTPWDYGVDLAKRQEFYSNMLREPLVPFAQAYGWDMLAFFEGTASSDPRVVLFSLDPVRRMNPIDKRLRNFDEWLEYAKQDAAQYRFENGEE